MEVWFCIYTVYLDTISFQRFARKISLKYLPYIGNEFIFGVIIMEIVKARCW